MNRIITIIAAVAAALAACNLQAQRAGLYWSGVFWPGNTNYVAANSTNFYYNIPSRTDTNTFIVYQPPQVQSVLEFTNLGVTVRATPLAPISGTAIVRWAKSYDNQNTWEAQPSLSMVVVFDGTNGNGIGVGTGCIDVDMSSHIELWSFENTNGVGLTNVSISYFLKSPKFGAFPATR